MCYDLKFLKHYFTDKPEVSVHAHMEDYLWSIQIFEKDDIYAVEVFLYILYM